MAPPAGFAIPRSAEEPANPEITRVEGTMLFHQRRRLKDGELWFFANSSLEAAAAATVETQGKSVERLDPLTGSAAPYPASIAAGSLEFSVALPPAGSLLRGRERRARSRRSRSAARGRRAGDGALAAGHRTRLSQRHPHRLLRPDAERRRPRQDVYFFKAADEVFKAYGFQEGDPWNTSVQFKTTILDRNKFVRTPGLRRPSGSMSPKA